jgi:hypothetical protein
LDLAGNDVQTHHRDSHLAHRSEVEAEIQIRQTGQSAGWKNARRFDNALRKS